MLSDRQTRQPVAMREMEAVNFPAMCAGENDAEDIPHQEEGKEETPFKCPSVFSKNEQGCLRGKHQQQLHHPMAVRPLTATETKVQKEKGERREKFK